MCLPYEEEVVEEGLGLGEREEKKSRMEWIAEMPSTFWTWAARIAKMPSTFWIWVASSSLLVLIAAGVPTYLYFTLD